MCRWMAYTHWRSGSCVYSSRVPVLMEKWDRQSVPRYGIVAWRVSLVWVLPQWLRVRPWRRNRALEPLQGRLFVREHVGRQSPCWGPAAAGRRLWRHLPARGPRTSSRCLAWSHGRRCHPWMALHCHYRRPQATTL